MKGKRLLYMSTTMVLLLVLMLTAAPAQSEVTIYLDSDGEVQQAEDPIPIDESSVSLAEGWYVVNDSVETGRLQVVGNVRLILADGTQLTVNGGIEVTVGNSLTIYAQSTEEYMGSLEATGGDYGAGIGGGHGGDGGTVEISGGIVTATGGDYGAGIGSGLYGDGGTVEINGGDVTAIGGQWGAGIGGGYEGDGGTVEINGGTVFAHGQDGAFDIGAGAGGSPGELDISGTAAVFLRNDRCDLPDTVTHEHVNITGHTAGATVRGIVVEWSGDFGAYLPFEAPKSNDAALSALTVGNVTLRPRFNPSMLSYTASVIRNVGFVVVTPTANHPGATITVNGQALVGGSAGIALGVGRNIVKIVVTAEDGITQKTYTITITRERHNQSHYNPYRRPSW